MTATGLACSSCGVELPQSAKFCLQCGASVSTAAQSAEYKQVTVLFADVVHSMDIAATVHQRGSMSVAESISGPVIP